MPNIIFYVLNLKGISIQVYCLKALFYNGTFKVEIKQSVKLTLLSKCMSTPIKNDIANTMNVTRWE